MFDHEPTSSAQIAQNPHELLELNQDKDYGLDMGDTLRKAATTRLEPGEHSIDRVTPKTLPGGRVRIEWSVRLKDGRLIDNKRNQGKNVTEAQRRAKREAARLLATGGETGAWTGTSKIEDYIEQVVVPKLDASGLSANSLRSYKTALTQMMGDCKDRSRPCKHTKVLRGHSLASATRTRTMIDIIDDVARQHGAARAAVAKHVLSRWIVDQLVTDQVVDFNVIKRLTVESTRPPVRMDEGTDEDDGKALTEQDYARLVDHLLQIDYTDVEKPKRGRWGIDAAIAKRRNVIDLTLIQATTGLRVSEANKIKAKHVEVAGDGTMLIHATREVIKGGGNRLYSPRTVPVLDERVAQRILARCNERGPEDRLIGSPTKPSTVWDESNCQDETQALYQELARDCDVPLLSTARTHVWRHTLNTVLLAEVPEVVRAAFFGHTADVNRSRYTDLTNAHTMIRAMGQLSLVQTGDSGLGSGLAECEEMIPDVS